MKAVQFVQTGDRTAGSLSLLPFFFFFFGTIVCSSVAFSQSLDSRSLISAFSSSATRGTGTQGYDEAVNTIVSTFEQLGLEAETQKFAVPIRRYIESTLTLDGKTYPLQPLEYNAITPQAIHKDLKGPLVYVGKGSLAELSGKDLKGSIIVMDLDSGKNWLQAAGLGAAALIYLDDEKTTSRYLFEEKSELSPLNFPCFRLSRKQAEAIPGLLERLDNKETKNPVTLRSQVQWYEKIGRNIYTIIGGSDPELKNELLIIEAFYDGSYFVTDQAPAADEAVSVTTLLQLAGRLKKNPPPRSVMLIATSGHAQALAGMRELIWALSSKRKDVRKNKKELSATIKETEKNLELLAGLKLPLEKDHVRDSLLTKAIHNRLKLTVDSLSRELMHLRMKQQGDELKDEINNKAKQRLEYRRLGWRSNFDQLSEGETDILTSLLPNALKDNKRRLEKAKKHLKALKSSIALRKKLYDFEIAAVVSLHLSSHGKGIGGFHQGWLYNLKKKVNRSASFSTLAKHLNRAGSELQKNSVPYIDTLRPDSKQSWDSWFLDRPGLGGEVSSLGGFLGLSLVTLGDSRAGWGTPWDTAERVDLAYVDAQLNSCSHLIYKLATAPKLHKNKLPRNGFATVSGRANLLLQGELFADFPARKTVILAYQGLTKLYASVNPTGTFQIKGVADKKHVLDKLIIEGYRFDGQSGETLWAIDKKETGKSNYRLKIRRKTMKTDLVMFNCRQTTIFDLLDPRSFQYMTKLNLLDGKRNATPQHYWYSRIDTRRSTISTIFTEPGTWLKLTLSDSVLTRKLILSGGSDREPMGYGYPVDTTPALHNTVFHAANDIWALLAPRIDNLEKHGIYDARIADLQERGLLSLNQAVNKLNEKDYVSFKAESGEALALANRVYDQVDKTQKDVLFGVLFYIALFVPFAFCMERFLFNFANIYKRIAGFTGLLVGLIAVIYKVHPAFQLAYSPMVMILAFFIIGLSLMVTLILFFRFEEEMELLQRRATHKRPSEISHWKAFVAAFYLGVSNLRRRRLRTVLTCTTLIILTFTIMSFTTIKSGQAHNRLLFQENSPYQGLLLKKLGWLSLPPESLTMLEADFGHGAVIAPRVWLESKDPSRTPRVSLRRNGVSEELQGLIGLSAKETGVSGMDKILTSGRWINEGDRQVILLEDTTAKTLNVTGDSNQTILLEGEQFTVIGTFSGMVLKENPDLDGEIITPVSFPQEAAATITEVEQEALESGDDVRSFQSRYIHTEPAECAIIPAATLLAMGGSLKNVIVRPDNQPISELAARLVDRFRLAIFAGDDSGLWLYNISDTISYSGVPNIIIPLIISIFIVLNTMISSVFERKNEIGIYTSVGLAPSHVSFLFIAEALALAVISVVLGYLFSQVSAALLADSFLWKGLTVNYSSLAGVAAMVLIIMVVLISVIYPSRLAGRIAIPDVNRTFKLPRPVDNKITVILPFFLKYHEHQSIGGFLHTYFQDHQDISHGLFSTGKLSIVFSCDTEAHFEKLRREAANDEDSHCMHLRTKVWLAPFDFGIMQWVDILFRPAKGNEDFLEIQLTIERRSGEAQLWHRINTAFLHNLRKQLLIWRSIDDQGHDHYKEQLQQVINSEQDRP
ncbi:MAG: FtsX-like permease family protein [Thermodesulfobacteriota bacterium]